jgi:hypothetical protein
MEEDHELPAAFQHGDRAMLKIQRKANGKVVLTLSGDLEADTSASYPHYWPRNRRAE